MKALVAVLMAVSAAPMVGQAKSPQLVNVLKQMDTASAKFQRATADVRRENAEKVGKQMLTSTSTGQIYFERKGPAMEMGAKFFAEGGKDKPSNVVEYGGGMLRMFEPGTNQVTSINAGANQAQFESFLTLGFGGSGADLDKNWTIQDGGAETITDSGKPVKVEKLDLVAKDAGARKNFSHVTIWVDAARGVSLKQEFFTPTGNVQTATYSNIVVNGNVHKDKFEIKKMTDKSTNYVNR